MRQKVMVVPFITDAHGRVRFVVVKEGRYNEWTFVCGNCKKNETSNPLKTALRELREESKDTMVLSTPLRYIFKYTPMIITEKEMTGGKGNQPILFHVFIFNVQGIKPTGVIKNYYTRMKCGYKKNNINYVETIGIAFMTITDLARKKMWPFVITKLINNQQFWEDVAFLRNENYKCTIQHDTKEGMVSPPTPWGSYKCPPNAVGRVEMVPRRTNPRIAHKQKICRYVWKSTRYSHFNTKANSGTGW